MCHSMIEFNQNSLLTLILKACSVDDTASREEDMEILLIVDGKKLEKKYHTHHEE